MRVPRAVAWMAVFAGLGCGAQDREAPYVEPPGPSAGCPEAEDLFSGFQGFLADGRFAPLKEVIQSELVPSADNPRPDPSWRSTVRALIVLAKELGLDRALSAARLAAREEVEAQLTPLFVTLLSFIQEPVDGQDRYAVLDAGGHFVARCRPEHLLEATEAILRLESPSRGTRWIIAVVAELEGLVADPSLSPFLSSFEREADRGRPAIVALLQQLLSVVADEDFAMSRIENLMRSAVYPWTDGLLEARLRALVEILGEATREDGRVLGPLQEAIRCGFRHPDPQEEILAFVVDVMASAEGLDLADLLGAVRIVDTPAIRSELDLAADVLSAVRRDDVVREELRSVLALFITQPASRKAVPVFEDMLRARLISELLRDGAQIVEGCDS